MLEENDANWISNATVYGGRSKGQLSGSPASVVLVLV